MSSHNINKRAVLTTLFTLCFVDFAFGHAYLSSLTIDGTVLKEGDCVRPHPSSKYDYPISSIDNPSGLQANDMTCGWLPNAAKAANRKCPVNPGSVISAQWHYEMGLGSSDTFYIDPSHRGPCLVYMAKSETGSGPVWFKAFQDGYDTKTKQFCVDKLRANKGRFDFTIPTDITPGNYLLRIELIALHEGFELGGAQPYVHCAEVTVGGSGTVNPGNLVTFPGAYKANDAGIFFDIYTDTIKSYPIPGPALYVSGTGVAPPATTGTSTTGSSVGNSGSTTGKTATPGSTTGKKATTGTTTGKSNTGSNGGSGSGSANGATTGANKLCYLPNTPNVHGKIKRSPAVCGKNSPKSRCADGQCCSQWGYCGPIPEKDGQYYETVDGVYQAISFDQAVSMYCTNSTGDYRKYPCSSLGSDAIVASEDDYADYDIVSSGLIVESNRIAILMSMLFVVVAVYLF